MCTYIWSRWRVCRGDRGTGVGVIEAPGGERGNGRPVRHAMNQAEGYILMR